MNITGDIALEPNIATNINGSEQNILVGDGSGALKARYGTTQQVVAQDSTASWYHDIGITFDASRSWSGSTSEEGNNATHNNLQPYLSIYIWKRTA